MAPFPLVTYADTQVLAGSKPIWSYMQSVLASGVMPLPPVQLDPADREALLGWLEAGAPPRLPSEVCSLADAGSAATDDEAAVPDALGDAGYGYVEERGLDARFEDAPAATREASTEGGDADGTNATLDGCVDGTGTPCE
jgi:hypothetical protein